MKQIVALLLALSLCFVLCACGGNSEYEGDDSLSRKIRQRAAMAGTLLWRINNTEDAEERDQLIVEYVEEYPELAYLLDDPDFAHFLDE